MKKREGILALALGSMMALTVCFGCGEKETAANYEQLPEAARI